MGLNHSKSRATMNGKSDHALHRELGHPAKGSWSSVLALFAMLYTWVVAVAQSVAFLTPSQKGGIFLICNHKPQEQAVALHERNAFKIEQHDGISAANAKQSYHGRKIYFLC